jgi:hypothetical protein
MSAKKFYFRCTTNPMAKPLVLDSYWEAQEMRNHPDYERIDEFGEVIVDEADQAERPIPFVSVAQAQKRA